MTAIYDGADLARRSPAIAEADPRTYLLGFYPTAPIPPLDLVAGTAKPMVARINHGIWKASCSCGMKGIPSPGCVVFLDTPLGWCPRCCNRPWGGGWRRIVVPPAEERRQIEAILSCRPYVGNRNWEPGETLADLWAQNVEHGVSVPDGDVPPPVAAPGLLAPAWPSPEARALLDAMRPKRRERWIRRLVRR